MSNAKRFLSVILAIVMMCSTLVIGANAAYVAYKDSAIKEYNALDKAVLTTEQYATAAMDELDRMLNKEQMKFTKEDIIVGDIDLTSVDAAFDSVDTIIDGALFSSLKGMLGDLQYLNADAFETPDNGGVRRDTPGKTDLDIFYKVFQFLHDNTNLLVSFVEGKLDPGSILGALVDLSEFMDINKLLKGLLYEFAYGVEGTDEQVVASSVDTMAQHLIDKYVADGYTDEDGEFVEPLVPALKGMTNISTGTTYNFLDSVLKVLYNELLIPIINEDLGETIKKLCGVEYIDNGDGTYTLDYSNLNEYADLLNVDYEVPTYNFTSDTFISQGNNIIKSIFDAIVNSDVMVWQAGDKTVFKDNLVNVAKQLFINAGDKFFADYIELATEEEIEAMTAEQLVVYAVRAIINSSSFGMYIPETESIHEFAFIALQQILATDVPELDFSNLDPNSTDSLVIMGINYAIHAVSAELDMGLEFVDSMEGVEAQLKKAMDYAVDNYAGVLNGIKFSETASAWDNLNTLLFSIIPASWLPASANNDFKTFLFALIDNIADLNFEFIFEMFEYRSDSELQKTPKQVIINLVTRVVNIIFPGAFKSATTLDALVTNQALAGTVRAIFDALWNYKENLAKVALPIVCSILDLTNAQEFEFPELTWDPTDANVDGNSIRTAGSVAVKLMVRNGSTGINTGYTDANGVFHQDQLYTYDIKSVTSNVSALNITYPDTIAGGQTVEMSFTGAVRASTPLVVTMTYDVLTEDGSPLTEEPITETIYSYIAYNESPDDTTKLTSTAVGGFTITDGPRYLYANSFGDLEDIEITIQNTNATAATVVPYYTLTGNASANNFHVGQDGFNGPQYLQARTEETSIMEKVGDAAGIANIKIFETTEAYDALTDEERDALWDSMIAHGTITNPRTGAITRYPRTQYTVGATINGSTKVQNTGALVFLYKDYGLPGILESEMGKHRQASAYATADSTVFPGSTVWEAYGQAMEEAAKAVYSCFRNTTFATPTGKFSFYEPAYNNLSKAIEELDAQVLSAGVASSQELIDKCYPSNPEDLMYYDPAYIHQGVSDYVPYTYYNFRDELRALEDMIYWATTPDEDGNVAVVNELDKTYKEHRFSLYFGRLLKVDNVVKTHLQREVDNPSREIGEASEYSPESWYNYEVALNFAISTLNDADANPTKVKAAYRNLLEEEKRLVPAGEGGGDIGGDVSFEPVNPTGGDAIPEIIETEDGLTVITGIGYDLETEEYFVCNGCYVKLTANEDGSYSTGAVITIKDTASDAVLAEYQVAVFGDINGDGATDAGEISLIVSAASGSVVYDGLLTTAADINLDGAADAGDISPFVSVASGAYVVDPVARVLL